MKSYNAIKVVIMGNAEIGKTSIVHRFIKGGYKENIGKTFGGAFYIK